MRGFVHKSKALIYILLHALLLFCVRPSFVQLAVRDDQRRQHYRMSLIPRH
jgi:hypothetical protein